MTIHKNVILAAASALIAGNLAVSLRYGAISTDPRGTVALIELPGYTRNGVLTKLSRLHDDRRAGTTLDDGAVDVVSKLDAAYTPSQSFLTFEYDLGRYPINRPRPRLLTIFPPPGAPVQSLRREISLHNRNYPIAGRILLRASDGSAAREFDRFVLDPRIVAAAEHPDQFSLLESVNPRLFNGWGRRLEQQASPALVPYDEVRNRLIQVRSERMHFSLDGDRLPVWQPEPDYFAPNRALETVGRYLLFNIVNPAPKVRFVVSLTETLRADGENRLPPMSVVSGRRYGFPVLGRGSARVFSEAFTPDRTGPLSFADIDFGIEGRAFPERRTGLMKLFGNEFPLDARKIVGFVRDISVISDADYRAMRAPHAISAFPGDLFDDTLAYSGFYDDGWVAEDAYACLSAPRGGIGRIVVRGAVPNLDFGAQRISVFVDGRRVEQQALGIGPFEIAVIEAPDGARHKIQLHFDHSAPLPNGDARQVSAKIDFLGYD